MIGLAAKNSLIRPPLTGTDLTEMAGLLATSLEGLVFFKSLIVLGLEGSDEPAFKQCLISSKPVFDFDLKQIFIPLPDESGQKPSARGVALLKGVESLPQVSRRGDYLLRLARLTLEKFDLVQEAHRDPVTGLWSRPKLINEMTAEMARVMARPPGARFSLRTGRGGGESLGLILVRMLDRSGILEREGPGGLRAVTAKVAQAVAEAGRRGFGAARLDESVFAWLVRETSHGEVLDLIRKWAVELGAPAGPEGTEPGIRLAAGAALFPSDVEYRPGFDQRAAVDLAWELEAKAGRALNRAVEDGPGSFLTLPELRRKAGRIRQVLPLDRVIIDLGRSVGVDEGMTFLVHAQDGDGKPLGELTVLTTSREQATAELVRLEGGDQRVRVGDRLQAGETDDRIRLRSGKLRRIEINGLQVEVALDQGTGLVSARSLRRVVESLSGSSGSFCVAVTRLQGLLRQRAMVGRDEVDILLSKLAELAAEEARPVLTARAGVDCLALVWTGLSGEAGSARMIDLTERVKNEMEQDLLVGLAVHPYLESPAEEIVDRAMKALDHAAYPQSEPVVLFNSVSLNVSGDLFFGQGDFEAAAAEYERALAVDPEDVNVLLSLGACLGRLNRYAEAARYFERATELDPEDYMAWYNLGQARRRLGDLDEARSALGRAEEMAADDFAVLFGLGQVLLEAGRPGRAAKRLARAARLEDASPAVHRVLGEALVKSGRDEEALPAFKAAVKADPQDAEALAWLGWFYLEHTRDHEVALSLISQAVDIKPNNGLFRSRLGWAMLECGQAAESLSQFEAALELDEETGDVLLGKARALKSLGRANEAEPVVAEAVKLFPGDQRLKAEAAAGPSSGEPGRTMDKSDSEGSPGTEQAPSGQPPRRFSEGLLDDGRILDELRIEPGMTVLDAGCGTGYMSRKFTHAVGSEGRVYALDIDGSAIRKLAEEFRGIGIEALQADITRNVPLASATVDLIYMSTVFHIFSQADRENFGREVRRLLKPGGRLALVEIDKRETPFGPPLNRRHSPRELRSLIPLNPGKLVRAGEYFYMQLFTRDDRPTA